MGWMGDMKQLRHVLNVMGADKDEEGKYLVYREPVSSFTGMGEEVVVSDKTEYSVNGERVALAATMNSTSYGVRGIKVI